MDLFTFGGVTVITTGNGSKALERHEFDASAETESETAVQEKQIDHEDDTSSGPEEHSDGDVTQHLRMLEALLFAATEPVDERTLQERLPEGVDIADLLGRMVDDYKNRGVTLVCVAGRWTLRTAPDLSFLMERERKETRRLSRAAIETLAIIAYHQPATRAEIEQIRSVTVSKGTIDLLMELGWVRLRGRRHTPGRPVTYGTTDEFLSHFGLENVQDLPGLEELKGAGLLDARLPPGFSIPLPTEASDDEDQSLTEEGSLETGEEELEFHVDFLDDSEDIAEN